MTRLRILPLFITLCTFTLHNSTAWAANSVVASIKPIHSLVAAIMKGMDEPGLIIKGANSPHHYTLKPSQATELEKAAVIFWIGHELETSLEKPLETLGENAKVIALADTPGLKKLAVREGGAFDRHEHGEAHERGHRESHEHDEHHKTAHGTGHGNHEEHRDEHHKEHHDERHKEHHDDHHKEHHDEHHQEHHGVHNEDHMEVDNHFWLDPENAKILAFEIAKVLSQNDPTNAERYDANAKAFATGLDALNHELADQLKPVQSKPFIVFHDAYQYFENRFGLTSAGSITINPEVLPGAERIAEIHEKIQKTGVSCIFAEPQFPSKLISVVSEGTNAKIAVLDPLGADLDDGPELYFSLMRTMAKSIRDCLLSGT